MKPITKSRNLREGGYLGYYRSVYDNLGRMPFDALPPPRRRHHRKGGWHWRTLREMRGGA